jgi:outer membrane autotransporter protein
MALATTRTWAVTGCWGTTTITCTSSGNPYASGIPYSTNVIDLSLIVQGDVVITSTADGILLDNDDADNDIIIDIASGAVISTSGESHFGIYIDDAATVDIDSAAAITTQGLNSPGVSVRDTAGGVNISITGNITTTGSVSHGILVYNTHGDVDISTSSDITTNADVWAVGIEAYRTEGDVDISASGTITTAGYYSKGVYVYDTTGNVTLTISGDVVTARGYAGNATVDSYAHGIFVYRTEGDVDVALSGSILTYGAFAHGIYVRDSEGNATVDVTGTIAVMGSGSDGITVGDIGGAVEVGISGSVTGGSGEGAGLRLVSLDSTSTPSVTIRGSLGALSDIAIVDSEDSADAITIANSGTIIGIVMLGDGADTFNNSGTWYLRYGTAIAAADFGDGIDSFTNDGALSLLKSAAGQWSGQLVNLESFTNRGAIVLADGTAGDTLSISGNFLSDGGTFRLDTVLDDGATPQTDMLQLDTVTTSSGPTHIRIQNAGGQGGQTSGNGVQIIDVATSSASDAFDLGDEQLIAGAYEYNLVEVGEDWYLQSNPFENAAEYPAIVSGAMLAWQADLDVVQNHLRGLSWNTAGEEPHIEPVAWNGTAAQEIGPWFNVLSASQDIKSDIAYKQKITRFDAGLDGEIETGRSRILLGAFAGMGQHEQDFADSTSKTTTDSVTAGAYGKYHWRGFYGDGIFKYEHHFARFSGAATVNEQTTFDLDLLGLSLGTGYRVTGQHFYVQPSAGLDYVHAKADSFEDASGATIELSNGDSLAGELGARFGAALPHAELYFDAGVSHEFLGETRAEVSGLTFSNDLPGTVGLVSAGLSTRAADDKLLLTLETGYAKGPEAEEFTATGNFWLKF